MQVVIIDPNKKASIMINLYALLSIGNNVFGNNTGQYLKLHHEDVKMQIGGRQPQLIR